MSQQINLFNPVFLKQKRYLSALAMAQALAMVFAGCAAIYAYARYQNENLVVVAANTEAQLKRLREQVVTLSVQFSDQGRSKMLGDELALADAQLLRRQQLFDDMLKAGGGERAGFTPYLQALARQPMAGVWLTAVVIGGKSDSVVITGRGLEADLVPAYIRSLNRQAPFAGRSVTELNVAAKLAPKPPAPQAPAAASVPAADPAAVNEPTRYVEFSLTIPVGAARDPAPATGKGAS